MKATKDSFDATVRKTIAHHVGLDPAQVEPALSLTNDLGLDPLDLVLIALRLEDIEQIDFPIEQLGTVHTVGELTRLFQAWIQASELGVPVLASEQHWPTGLASRRGDSARRVVRPRVERVRRMRRAS